MNDFINFMAECFKFFKIPITIYGYTFSLWDVILFTAVACVLIRLVTGIIALGGGDD